MNVSTGYSHGPVDMGRSLTTFIGKLFTGYWSNNSCSIGTKWNGEEIRPVNSYVMYIIKI